VRETPIDRAFRAQAADPEDAAARLRLYERVLDAELLLVLAAPPGGDRIEPLTFDLAEGPFVLAFDRDDRLADFLGEPAPFAALSGRRAVALLAGRGTGLAVNLGAPSATVLGAEAVAWLAGMAGQVPAEAEARASRFAPPDPPAAVVAALGPKIAAMADRIGSAHLVEAHYPDGSAHLLLVLAGTREADRAGMAAAIAEAVGFAGPEGVGLDVAFLEPGTPGHAAAGRVGLRLELPAPPPRRPGPGTDPDRPPALRGGRGQ
jgi:hypothetical protein